MAFFQRKMKATKDRLRKRNDNRDHAASGISDEGDADEDAMEIEVRYISCSCFLEDSSIIHPA